MRILIVNKEFDNKKLISFLTNQFPNVSANVFYKALRKKDIRINNIKISENVLLHVGDEIKLYITDNYFLSPSFKLDMVYEDENLLVVNKPKGIEVTGDNSLTTVLRAMPCHRLDRNTEGLVIFAKSDISLKLLLEKIKNHEITKFYKCKAYGIFNKKQDILNAYLFKDSKKSFVYISDKPKKGYREIVTQYKVIEENILENYSILEITLHTGRTHQIRAHLAHIGHPIIGDR